MNLLQDMAELFKKLIKPFRSIITSEEITQVRTERKQAVMSRGKVYIDGKEITGRKANKIKKTMKKAKESMKESTDVTEKERTKLGKKVDKVFKSI